MSKPVDGFQAIADLLKERSTTGLSFSNVRDQLRGALDEAHPGQYCWIAEIHGTAEAGDVIYSMGSKTMRRKYKISQENGKRKTNLGDAAAVLPRIAWDEVEPSGTPVETTIGESVKGRELMEAASGVAYPIVDAKTPRLAKLISPGWGSSGFYSEEVLKAAAKAGIFKAGTHMYMNHATRAEEAQRPEGDMLTLAGVLTGNAFWDGSHKEGPGLYAPMDVFTQFATHVAETAPYTGLSIKARGTGHEGKIGGKSGFIVDELLVGESVDFVTHAGRGGKALTESATTPQQESETTMTKEEVQALIEAGTAPIKAQNATLLTENGVLRAQVLRFNQRALQEDARKIAVDMCANPELRLGEAVRTRIVQRVMVQTIPVDDAGVLKEADWKKIVEGEIKDETAYLASLTGGAVRGLGESAPATPAELKPEEAKKRMVEAFIAQGFTKEQAEVAAEGRVN